MSLLEIDRLTVSYGPVMALQDVSFAVEAGRVTAIIGANGAGKSTCLKAVSGLATARAGSIRYDGHPIHAIPARRRVRLGIAHVLEGRRLFADQSVEDNLLLGGYSRLRGTGSMAAVKSDRKRMYDRFAILSERRHQRALTLSGGEQQMLAIAVALMSRPRLLLLDEPSLGLAPKIVEQLAQLIMSLRDEGTAILLVEQMAFLALSLADYGYSLERGRVVASGSPATLRKELALQEGFFGKA
jgi:branched-chain amino acid transport system ATP-binding protein